MTKIDFAPLYRSTVGFDHLASLFDSIGSEGKQTSYPPYNIQREKEDRYKITMAVAGFSKDEIEVSVENEALTVSAQRKDRDGGQQYLYRGIAERNFRRQFRLDNYVKVVGASLENGLLHISLNREIPETLKPKVIPINVGLDLDKPLCPA